jgi:hypothetical protein
MRCLLLPGLTTLGPYDTFLTGGTVLFWAFKNYSADLLHALLASSRTNDAGPLRHLPDRRYCALLVEGIWSEATQRTSYTQIKRSTSTWKLMPLLGTQTA